MTAKGTRTSAGVPVAFPLPGRVSDCINRSGKLFLCLVIPPPGRLRF